MSIFIFIFVDYNITLCLLYHLTKEMQGLTVLDDQTTNNILNILRANT